MWHLQWKHVHSESVKSTVSHNQTRVFHWETYVQWGTEDTVNLKATIAISYTLIFLNVYSEKNAMTVYSIIIWDPEISILGVQATARSQQKSWNINQQESYAKNVNVFS